MCKWFGTAIIVFVCIIILIGTISEEIKRDNKLYSTDVYEIGTRKIKTHNEVKFGMNEVDVFYSADPELFDKTIYFTNFSNPRYNYKKEYIYYDAIMANDYIFTDNTLYQIDVNLDEMTNNQRHYIVDIIDSTRTSISVTSLFKINKVMYIRTYDEFVDFLYTYYKSTY